MAKGLIQQITEELKSYSSKVLLVQNNDRFLYRGDVVDAFALLGIEISNGTNIAQRIKFELREQDGLLVLLSQDKSNYLEDMLQQAVAIEFRLANYLQTYHIPSVADLELPTLDKLLSHQPLVKLSKSETLQYVQRLKEGANPAPKPVFNLDEFALELETLLNEKTINWSVVSRLIARGVLVTIGTPQFDVLYGHVNKANEAFQEELHSSYRQTKNSSPVKKPRIVSKILDFLNFNYRKDKIALIVVDGMALWQYELLRDRLPGSKSEDIIYSWIPSITQLSRQAIFRGDTPLTDYKQGPVNEKKLWNAYWESKGCNAFEIGYQHEQVDLRNLNAVSKLAIVFKDLDEKMHSSTDYIDLLALTNNWIERSEVTKVVEELLAKNFTIFMTTDHGNIQARGWRGLKGREKLGTNKSGSRSSRHLEYTEKWLSDEFVTNNLEIQDDIVKDEQAIYFKSDLSFSTKDSLVTHGGAHLLEVLIPFITIKNDAQAD
jgi:hypothetical protein